METIEFYQKALADSAQKMMDANAQVYEYMRRLMYLRENYIAKKIIGREYPALDLIDSLKHWECTYENVPFKCIGMDYTCYNSSMYSAMCDNSSMIELEIRFMRDPDVLLKSRLKLTEREKQLLKKMKDDFWHTYEGRLPLTKNYDELSRLHNELCGLKHRIGMVIECSWYYDFSKLMDKDFLINGLRAQKSIFSRYDRTQ